MIATSDEKVVVPCRHCGAKVRCRRERLGEMHPCPRCELSFVLREPEDIEPSPESEKKPTDPVRDPLSTPATMRSFKGIEIVSDLMWAAAILSFLLSGFVIIAGFAMLGSGGSFLGLIAALVIAVHGVVLLAISDGMFLMLSIESNTRATANAIIAASTAEPDGGG